MLIMMKTEQKQKLLPGLNVPRGFVVFLWGEKKHFTSGLMYYIRRET